MTFKLTKIATAATVAATLTFSLAFAADATATNDAATTTQAVAAAPTTAAPTTAAPTTAAPTTAAPTTAAPTTAAPATAAPTMADHMNKAADAAKDTVNQAADMNKADNMAKDSSAPTMQDANKAPSTDAQAATTNDADKATSTDSKTESMAPSTTKPEASAAPTTDATSPTATSATTDMAKPAAATAMPAATDETTTKAQTSAVIPQEKLLDFAQKAALASFTYDYSNYQQDMKNMQSYFTKTGWESFNKALTASNNLDVVQKEKLSVTAEMNGQAEVTQHQQTATGQEWQVTVPVIVTYKNDKAQTIKQDLKVKLAILTVNSNDNPNGMGINQFVAMPDGKAMPSKTAS